MVAVIDEIWRCWKFELLTIFCLFAICSDLHFRGGTGSAPKMHWNTEEDFERGKNLAIKPQQGSNHCFKGYFFAVESKSGIKKLVNLLLLEIIGPKNATLFFQDHFVEHYLHVLNNSTPHGALSIQPEENVNIKWMQCFKIQYIVCCYFGYHSEKWTMKLISMGGTVGWEVMTPWSWSLMNKVAFLGQIISRSKRFTSILMADLDSTAKSNFRNNVF